MVSRLVGWGPPRVSQYPQPTPIEPADIKPTARDTKTESTEDVHCLF
jgi:hypothetical protein